MTQQFLILDHMPHGAFVLRQDLTVLFWNTCLEKWTGILREQIVGHPVSEFFPHLSTSKYTTQFAQVFQNGLPLIFSPHLHKYIIPVTFDKETSQVQTTTVTRLPANDGTEHFLLFSIQDVTELAHRIKDYRAMRDQAKREVQERKQAEKALQHVNMHLENIFNAAIPLCVTLTNFDMSQVNDAYCDLFGVAIEDAFGRKCYESRPGPACHTPLCPMQQIMNGAEKVEYEMLKIRKDGTPVYCIVTARPYRDLDGTLLGIVENFQNITQRKQAEEALYEAREAAELANSAKSRFLATMSHELRTPLNAILGFAHILERDVREGSEQWNHLALIIRNGEHLLTLINQVLDLSKIEAGKLSVVPQNFDLHHLLREVLELFALQAAAKRLQLFFDCPPDTPQYVRTDQIKLRQILINLLSNALKFTQQGRITLSVSHTVNEAIPPSSAMISFSVNDTGTGLTPDELALIFEAFTQTTAGQAHQQGTGLGLTISKRFAHLLQGDLTVDSTVGQGTTFVCSLPVELIDASDLPHRPSLRRVRALAPGQPQYRILLADKNAENRQLLVKLLEPPGFLLHEACNAEEAFDLWKSWTPHAILMDIYMPGISTYDIIRHMRDEERARQSAGGGAVPAHTVIIAFTASVLEEEERSALEAGCDAFLRKPFNPSEMFEMLHQHLGVYYLYEDPTLQTEKDDLLVSDAEISTALAQLAPDITERLNNAVLTTNITLLAELFDEIRRDNPLLADRLASLADNFDYARLIELL